MVGKQPPKPEEFDLNPAILEKKSKSAKQIVHSSTAVALSGGEQESNEKQKTPYKK